MTDTARYADIVLPATSQLEQIDLHKAYGHRYLQYNHAAIAPLGEAKSNWDVMRLLARGDGLRRAVAAAGAPKRSSPRSSTPRARTNPLLDGITLERLQAEGTVPLHFAPGDEVPFADLALPDAVRQGRAALRRAWPRDGLDPLPDYTPPAEFASRRAPRRTAMSGWC